jgi:nucleotide-binding universal stress UspA family protein
MSAIAELHEKKQSVEFKRVLFATDFSDASRRALAFALAIARRYDSALSVVHAIPPEPRDPIPLEPLPANMNRRRIDAEQLMSDFGREGSVSAFNPHLIVEQGRVWDVLASVIRRENVDLLVLGTHGRGGLKKAMMGSIAEQVLRLAQCPVLTIGPHVPPLASESVEFGRILFATDFGNAAAKAFPYALSLAEAYRAKLVLLHMVPPMPSADVGPSAYGPSSYGADECMKWQRARREESIKKLKELLPCGAKLASEPECIAAMDFLPEGILQVAASHKTELIVMGANRTSTPRLTAHMPWALTHAVLCHATCPVLTVSN